MTPNNLHGHTKGIRWREVYREEFSPGLFVVVTSSYEAVYAGTNQANWQDSSHLCVKTTVTDGTTHQWSNGVLSYKDIQAEHPSEFRTARGWCVKSHELAGGAVKYTVEVPEVELLSLALHGVHQD